jgi:alpha-galactosidase
MNMNADKSINILKRTGVALLLASCPGLVAGAGSTGNAGFAWTSEVAAFPYAVPEAGRPVLQVVRQDFADVQINQSVLKDGLEIAGRRFEHGVGVWAESCLRVYSPRPIVGCESFVGVDSGPRHMKGRGNVAFTVLANGTELWRSGNMTGGDGAKQCSITFAPVHTIELRVSNAGENPVMNHADWGEACVVLQDGDRLRLDEMQRADIPFRPSRYPFSFIYDGRPSDELLVASSPVVRRGMEGNIETAATQWDLSGGLRLTVETRRFRDFPAIEWLMWFENTGGVPTPILENIQSMDIVLNNPITGPRKIGPYLAAVKDHYILHRTEGDSGTHNPAHFLAETLELNYQQGATMGAEAGRPSQKTLPFYKIDTGDGALILAVGWSGQWQSTLDTPDGRSLRLRAGLETTRFKLLPGEKVRLARMLALRWVGDTWDANAQFRKLIYKHYAATLAGKKPLPEVWANTWCIGKTDLNKQTAADTMELIRLYSRLKGARRFITDAGWYKGGFGTGDGDYVPNSASWPDGVGPVAKTAAAHGIGYGLWFDVEKVFGGTDYAREHPDWLLSPYSSNTTDAIVADEWGSGFRRLKADDLKKRTPYLRNLGDPAVVSDLYDTISRYLSLPGMGAYRQDFNANPLAHWRLNDAPDRQGITEIKYIMGLYGYWEKLAAGFPAVLRDQCSSGGRRIDLETIMRMHVHQKSDLSRHPEADQSGIWGLSQYLPNNVFSAIAKAPDDYNFLSAAPAGLALGWRLYASNFNHELAQKYLDIHQRIRPLLIDSWYPLTNPNLETSQWMASQYHRTDLNQGLIIAYRRADSVYRVIDVNLREIVDSAEYELEYLLSGKKQTVSGAALRSKFGLTIAKKPGAEFILYARKNP